MNLLALTMVVQLMRADREEGDESHPEILHSATINRIKDGSEDKTQRIYVLMSRLQIPYATQDEK